MRGHLPPRAVVHPRIVFEDDHVLVLDKPAGLLSATPPGSDDPSAFDFVKRRAGPRARGGPARAFVIHRLDREASGLLVFAKNERAFRWLKEDFRAKRVHRLYLALVEGELRTTDGRPASGAMQGFLRETRGIVHVLREGEFVESPRGAHEPQARLAVTHYRAVAAGQGRTLVELRMETGRKHQIRAQLAGLGHPVCGDALYGAHTDPAGRLCLHATQLGFRHPGTGQQMDFTSPPPTSFWTLAGAQPPAGAPAQAGTAPRTEMPVIHPAPPPPPGAFDTSWDHVAEWYDQLVDEEQSDHYRDVILPGTVHLLGDVRDKRILDLACGQGVLSRHLAALGARVVGVDASAALIEAARRRGGAGIEYHVADVRQVGSLGLGRFDAVASVMALMNIDPLDPVLQGCAQLLAPNGTLVVVVLHPAFRAPRQTSWGFETAKPTTTWLPKPAQRALPKHKGGPQRVALRQFRKVEGYLSAGQFEIVMNPGEVAHGKPKVTTWTFHRPLQTYVKLLRAAGFLVASLEEWPSLRRSAPGRHAAEENRARREIPLFLGMQAVLSRAPLPAEPEPPAGGPEAPVDPNG